MSPLLQQGMFIWDPTDGGTLYAVAKILKAGNSRKAVLIQHTGTFATKIEMKHDKLPKGCRIVDQRELINLINQHRSQLGLDAARPAC